MHGVKPFWSYKICFPDRISVEFNSWNSMLPRSLFEKNARIEWYYLTQRFRCDLFDVFVEKLCGSFQRNWLRNSVEQILEASVVKHALYRHSKSLWFTSKLYSTLHCTSGDLRNNILSVNLWLKNKNSMQSEHENFHSSETLCYKCVLK